MHCQKMETHSRKINYQYEKSKRRATEIIGLFKIILTLSKSCPGQVEAWLLQKEYKLLRFVMHKTGIITWNTYKEKASWILRETLLTAIAAMHRNRLLRLCEASIFSSLDILKERLDALLSGTVQAELLLPQGKGMSYMMSPDLFQPHFSMISYFRKEF